MNKRLLVVLVGMGLFHWPLTGDSWAQEQMQSVTILKDFIKKDQLISQELNSVDEQGLQIQEQIRFLKSTLNDIQKQEDFSKFSQYIQDLHLVLKKIAQLTDRLTNTQASISTLKDELAVAQVFLDVKEEKLMARDIISYPSVQDEEDGTDLATYRQQFRENQEKLLLLRTEINNLRAFLNDSHAMEEYSQSQ